MEPVTPIETKYNGYLFRSRLEARWAVFFDALEVKYFYEHEGYDLTAANNDPSLVKDGTPLLSEDESMWYLPDFYLPDYNVCVEIKPVFDVDDSKAADKCFLLSTIIPTIFVWGTPGPEDYMAVLFEKARFQIQGRFAEGRKCDRLWMVNDDHQRPLNCETCWSPKCADKTTWQHKGLEKAYEAARSARF